MRDARAPAAAEPRGRRRARALGRAGTGHHPAHAGIGRGLSLERVAARAAARARRARRGDRLHAPDLYRRGASRGGFPAVVFLRTAVPALSVLAARLRAVVVAADAAV